MEKTILIFAIAMMLINASLLSYFVFKKQTTENTKVIHTDNSVIYISKTPIIGYNTLHNVSGSSNTYIATKEEYDKILKNQKQNGN